MKAAAGLVVALVCSTILATEPAQRTLTFDERVRAQTAIERVYYSHQLGAKKNSEMAVPAAVIEAKVHKYLDQTVALKAYWKTEVSDQSLQRELERMAQGTRMPERLQELFAALGNDPFLVKECLARPALVDRFTRNFYAFDPTLHVRARAQAGALRARLVSGELSPSTDNSNRTISELVVGATDVGPSPAEQSLQQRLTPEEFAKRRAEYPARVGQVSGVKETRDAFAFSVVLSETTTDLHVANYVVPKISWDAWWTEARRGVHGDSVLAVASGALDLPAPHAVHSTRPSTTCADDYWDNGILDKVVPDARFMHVAVWTGTQMIIWGGASDLLSPLKSGGRYDPATDTWTPTSLTGAPTGRVDTTAVWTGSEMVVWGGRSPYRTESSVNTGGRYDPVSDTWAATSGRAAPFARYGHTAVWTGSRMVIWGGAYPTPHNPGYSWTSTGAQYDPATDTWTATTTIGAPSARVGHTAVWTGTLMVVWGGGSTFASGGRYDPASDRWAQTSFVDAPQGRTEHSAVWTGTEMIIWGGRSYTVSDPNCIPGYICYEHVKTGGRYNPTTDTWIATSTSDAPFARGGHTAVWTGSRMIVWGCGINPENCGTNIGGQYDPISDAWSSTAVIGAPVLRQFQTAVWTGSQMVIWGGQTGYDGPPITFPLNSGGRYDPVTDSWTPTDSNSGPASTSQTAVWTGNLMLGWGGGAYGARYDPVGDNWTFISPIGAPVASGGQTSVWTGSLMIVWGGENNRTGSSAGGRYDPVSDSWSPTSPLGAPSGRAYHTAVWTGISMVIWGGRSYIGVDGSIHDLDTGGRYDPALDAWTPTSQTGTPDAREQHTASWTGTSMVVWGGGVPNSYGQIQGVNTGGRYDPATDTWTPTSETDAPPARYAHTAVWTGNRVIVWGGRGDSCCEMDTGGRYDPSSDAWTPTSTTFAPNGRYGHSAIWTGRLMVIWGGYGNEGSGFLNRTGERYDPVSDGWSLTTKTDEPGVRAFHWAAWTGTAMIVAGGRFGWGSGGGGQYFPGTVMDDDCDGDGITAADGDCDDHNPSVYPGAPQICDGVNDDCNDPRWPSLQVPEPDADGDGFLACRDDCDDTNSSVYPGAPQVCDGVDNDCNNPGWPQIPADEADLDHDGTRLCSGDCDDRDASVGPGFYESCDGRDNDCNGVVDDGPVLEQCDDYNPCTDDTCGGAAGCVHTNNTGPCDDGNPCTTHDVCGAAGCAGTPRPGTACDDGNRCTSDDYCDQNGLCVGISPCDDGDQCTRDYADPTRSCACFNWPVLGMPCDDGDGCTTGEFCFGYGEHLSCLYGQPVSCSDDNPCTDDTCISPSGSCLHTPNDVIACNDGNPCTEPDTCQAGVCVGLTPADCAGPCPPGSTPTDGGCSLTYDIDGTSLDNLGYDCGNFGMDRQNDCFHAYGFHWTDVGRALGPVIRVELALETGVHCSSGPSSVSLNGSVIGSFVPVGACSCPSPHSEVSLTALSADSYSTSGVNHVYVLSRSGCEGLSADDGLGGNFARVTVTYQRRSGPCVVGACDLGVGGCTYADVPDGESCTDGDACTVGDNCGGGNCHPGNAADCDDQNPCTNDACDSALGCVHTATIGPCTDGNACTTGDTCVAGTCVAGVVTDCNDNSICTDDVCDPSHGCIHTAIGCNDNNPCTTDTCNFATGCVFSNNSNSCNDGNACTRTDVCTNGACVGSNPVTCGALDQCHTTGACDPASGVCSSPTLPDGTVCNDHDLCTTGETCRAGTCTPASSGLNEANPRTTGYYKRLCQGPHSGDQLTDADAVCVASVARTFAGVSTVADLCAELEPTQPNGDPCDRSDDDLMVLAINICRARVCVAQSIDSQCGTNGNVGQSLAESDAILGSASRNADTCAKAKCLDEEINTGRALELNSLTIRRDTGGTRLEWRPPYLNDGTGHPSKYDVWRRVQGSLVPFTKLGATTDEFFLDAVAEIGAFQYEVTAVMN